MRPAMAIVMRKGLMFRAWHRLNAPPDLPIHDISLELTKRYA